MEAKVKRESAIDLPDDLRLLSVERAAEVLGVSRVTVRRLVHRGELKATRIGTIMRVSLAELQRYLEQSIVTGPDPRRDSRRGRDKARTEPKPMPARRRARSKRKSVP